MLTRQVVRSSTVARRIIGTSISSQTRLSSFKPPVLADIHPDHVETFKQRQKEFRERQKVEAEESKRRALEESRAASADKKSSGSQLSGKAQAEEDAIASKKAGPLTTLIYGTKEGREMERDIERSFSQVLARGKYVHSIVTHQVKPDKVDEYVKLVGSWYPKVASTPEMKVNLVGSWRTEVGDCDTFGMK